MERLDSVMQVLYLDPERIERDPEASREDVGDLGGLAETIRDQGLLQPIGIVPLGRERYRVVYGGRRVAAALQLGLDRIPCIVLDPDDPDLFVRQLIENLQRQDLNDIEKARAFRRLREQIAERIGRLPEGELDERIGRAVGMAPRTVRRYLGLLDLPDEVQQLIRDGELTVTQAQHLRRVGQARTQVELARLAADEGLSAADISNLVNYFAANPNLTVDTGLQALQSGQQLRTSPPAPSTPAVAPPRAVHTPDPDDDGDLWEEDGEVEADEDAGSFAHLEVQAPEPRTKARVFRIRSLDQMVDETDRLSRAYHEGDLKKWVTRDEGAAFKLRLLVKQLRSLSRALEDLAGQQGWAIEEE